MVVVAAVVAGAVAAGAVVVAGVTDAGFAVIGGLRCAGVAGEGLRAAAGVFVPPELRSIAPLTSAPNTAPAPRVISASVTRRTRRPSLPSPIRRRLEDSRAAALWAWRARNVSSSWSSSGSRMGGLSVAWLAAEAR